MEIPALQSHPKAADVPLEQLEGNRALSEGQKVEEVSRQFEAVLLRQILTEAQKTTFKSKYTDDSTASAVYRDLTVQQMADQISRSGAFGLGATLAKQLDRQLEPAASAANQADHHE